MGLENRADFRSNGGMSTALSRAVLVLGLGMAVSGCTIQPGKVEENIKEKFKKEDVEIESIKCPSGVKMKDGATFECEGESDLGDSFTVEVKQTDGNGSIKWELQGRIVDPEELEKSLKKQGGPPDTKCGKGKNKLIAVKGTKVKCKGGGQEVTLKFTSDEGDWETQ